MFEKGKKRPSNAGRKKGTPNKFTLSAKEGVELTYNKLGGASGLYKWVKKDPKNEEIFYSKIILKLIPNDVNLGGQKDNPLELNATIQIIPVKAR